MAIRSEIEKGEDKRRRLELRIKKLLINKGEKKIDLEIIERELRTCQEELNKIEDFL